MVIIISRSTTNFIIFRGSRAQLRLVMSMEEQYGGNAEYHPKAYIVAVGLVLGAGCRGHDAGCWVLGIKLVTSLYPMHHDEKINTWFIIWIGQKKRLIF